MEVSVIRKAHFNAAHRLSVKEWTDEKNEKIFGPCSNQYFHGHNYEIEVKVTGPVDPITGFVINLDVLKQIIQTEIHDYLDHRNLNIEIEEFQSLVPSAENIAIVIYNRIRLKLSTSLKLHIRLYETPRNFVEFGE